MDLVPSLVVLLGLMLYFGLAPSLNALWTGPLLLLAFGTLVAAGLPLLLTMAGHERIVALVSVACLLVNVGLCAALIPGFGLEGAAAASASACSWGVRARSPAGGRTGRSTRSA